MAVEDRIIGPPGTGKTTTLTRSLQWNAEQVGGDAIVAISHTRAAAAELAGRDTILPRSNIGTLHSFAFRALEYPSVIGDDAATLREFGEQYPRFQFSITRSVEDLEAGVWTENRGDAMMAEYSRLRNKMLPRSAWPDMETVEFAELWDDFKREREGVDFTDLIELALADVETAPYCPLVMAVDEAQDTSRLQWALVQKWAAHCEKLITAGDPDQAIFVWAGADPEWFLENAPDRRLVLSQSYRLPRAVLAVALPWIQQIGRRDDVTYEARDADGAVRRPGLNFKLGDDVAALAGELARDGTVMILASCAYMLHHVIDSLRNAGTPFGNRYRRERGDWNPLTRRGEGSSLTALAAFLRPFAPGATHLWTADEARKWLAVTKGVLRHGEKVKLKEWPDELPPARVVQRMAQTFARREDVEAALAGDVDWFAARVLASRARVVSFAVDCVARHGPAVLTEEPRITIGTIHSVKGGEADSVILFPDLSSQGMTQWTAGERGRDDIIRQFYVGMTRAREALYVCDPATSMTILI